MFKRIIGSGVIADRELTNAKTGIDLRVPDFKIQRIKSGTHITFKLIAVTNIPEIVSSVKNVATGKMFESGVIHFAQDRTYDEFWKLRKDLDKKFSGTLVPEIPKRPGIGDKIVSSKSSVRSEAKNRQTSADNLLKWCASIPKIASSEILWKFLGWQTGRREENEKNDEENDKITEDTVKEIYKPTLNEGEIESELFKNPGLDLPESELFGEDYAPPSEQNAMFSNNRNDIDSQEFTSAHGQTARLFQTIPDISQDDVTLQLDSEDSYPQEVDETTNKESLLEEVDDDVSDVLSQIQSVSFKPPSATIKVFQQISNTTEVVQKVEVEKMADEDLINYIGLQESDDDVDLGF